MIRITTSEKWEQSKKFANKKKILRFGNFVLWIILFKTMKIKLHYEVFILFNVESNQTFISVLWQSDLTDKMKRSFFQAAVISILLYGCTTWTLTKRMEKKLDGNYTRMLRAILNKSWRQHPTKQQLYGHLPLVTETIKVRRNRHAGYYWRSRDELISDVLRWTPSQEQAKAGRPARTYIQQLCANTGCNPEDLPGAMDDKEGCRERVRNIPADGTTWWWWCICVCACVCICVCACVYICMYACVYICMYACIYMRVCMYVYMYNSNLPP